MSFWDRLVAEVKSSTTTKPTPSTRTASTPKPAPTPEPQTPSNWAQSFTEMLSSAAPDPRASAPPMRALQNESQQTPLLAQWSVPEQPETRFQGQRVDEQINTTDEWVPFTPQGAPGSRAYAFSMLNPGIKTIDGKQMIRNPNFAAGQPGSRSKLKESKDSIAARQRYEDRIQRMQDLRIVGDDLGMKTGALTTTEVPRGTPMTWDQYDALSQEQRNAVDFNTALSQAVKRDIKRQDKYDPSKKEREQYDMLVENTFGEDRGSDAGIYAPETMGLLQDLKLQDSAGDLDDYLSLRVVVTAKDLKKLNKIDRGAIDELMKSRALPEGSAFDGSFVGSAHAAANAPSLEERTAAAGVSSSVMFKDSLAAKTAELKQRFAEDPDVLLGSFRSTSRASRYEEVLGLGGIPGRSRVMLGFGKSPVDEEIQKYFGYVMGSKPEDTRDGLQALSEQSPELAQAVMDYTNARLRNIDEYGLDMGEGARYKRTDQVRKILGLKE